MAKTVFLNGNHIVIPDLIDALPFHSGFDWIKFQQFCTDLMFACYNTTSREYLKEGSKQEGIDIYTFDTSPEKLVVAQCKLKEVVKPSDIDKIISEFLKGEFSTKTKEFIICTSYDFGRSKKLENALIEARQTLKSKDIDLTLWDEQGLSIELRNKPTESKVHIVNRYFGEEIALKFLGEIYRNWTKKFTEIKKIAFEHPINHISRTISPHKNQTEEETNYLRYYDKDRLTLLSLIENRGDETQRIVLLSTAGYGKTEEIKNIAAYYSNQNKLIYPIPFYLRDYTGDSIEKIIENVYKQWQELQEEYLLLLFDGLDELQDENAQFFIDSLNAFSVRHPKANIIVSSRYNFYEPQTPPLRGFSIYVLNQLTYSDTNFYLESQLGTDKSAFLNAIKERKLTEYSDNPYYLTRLVRFYLDKEIPFPETKSNFFKTVLFERFEKDNQKFRTEDLETILYPIVQKIAVAMTLMGKSTFMESELKQIVPDKEQRQLIKQVCILNKNGQKVGNWSFEHKNLQEFLCASYFTSFTYEEVHLLISLPFDRKRLIPKLLNATSFLFEQLSNDSELFKKLFSWLKDNQPELLIRFEKEQMSPSTREAIFISIFNEYRLKGLPLYISSNFSIRELAWFVGITPPIIKFLDAELKTYLPDKLASNAIELLACCTKPYLLKKSLKKIIFETISNPLYGNDVHVDCIDAARSCGFLDQDTFNYLVDSGIDLRYFHTRKALIRFLSETNYYEQYNQFILDSILIFEEGQKTLTFSGSTDLLKALILKFSSAKCIKALLQYCVSNPSSVTQYQEYKSVHFKLSELKNILKKASQLYKEEPGMLRLVYRIFNERKNGPYYDDWRDPFNDFFEETCGTVVIFHKIYKYNKSRGDVVSFADKSCCDFLIAEYLNGKIEEKEMHGYRNLFSHHNRELFSYFYTTLNAKTKGAFTIDDLDVDYGQIYINYEVKNRQMLLNQTLFLEEANIVFDAIKSEKITKEDLLWDNVALRKYRDSYVFQAISSYRRRSVDKIISKASFIKKYTDERQWEAYVIEKIFNLLNTQKKEVTIHGDLILYATKYCEISIERTNFEYCLKDTGKTYTYNPYIEFLKQLILKLKPKLADKHLIKILPCEPEGYSDSEDNLTLSQFIIKNIRDKALLKQSVLNNLISGKLSTYSMCTHFWIAAKMAYSECTSQLYEFIIESKTVKGYEKRLLTKFYLRLGGNIEDFADYLKAPDPLSREDSFSYSSWEWFLIDEYTDKSATIPILKEIMYNDDYLDENRTHACHLLIKAGQIEGLKFWAEYIRINNKTPFDGYMSELHKSIAEMPPDESIPILTNTLEYAYKAGIFDATRFRDEFDRMIYDCLHQIAYKSQKNYETIKIALDEFVDHYKTESYSYIISWYSERLTQKFYEQLNYSPSIKEVMVLLGK